MSIAIFCQQWPVEPWLEILKAKAPALTIEVWPEIKAPDSVSMALCWKHQHGSLSNLSNLQCISSMGAGVDHLFTDPELPTNVPVVRIVDDNLTGSMFEYLIAAVSYYQRNFDQFDNQKMEANWNRLISPRFNDTKITILGLGELGGYAAGQFSKLGFDVRGWSRSGKSISGVACYHGNEELPAAVCDTDMIICLLPLTQQTENILDAKLFAHCNNQAVIINVARGQHLNETDLIHALDNGQIRGAMLDVFREEPLPPSHSFWQHPKIKISPHCSSVTNPASAVEQIIDNYNRLVTGKPLINIVNRDLGY